VNGRQQVGLGLHPYGGGVLVSGLEPLAVPASRKSNGRHGDIRTCKSLSTES
jgi:hypothetical protein